MGADIGEDGAVDGIIPITITVETMPGMAATAAAGMAELCRMAGSAVARRMVAASAVANRMAVASAVAGTGKLSATSGLRSRARACLMVF